MPVVIFDHDNQSSQMRNWWIYPPNCEPDYEDYAMAIENFWHRAEYVRESRPYPEDLWSSLTDRPLVYRRRGQCPIGYSVTYSPCPHGGTHGQIEKRYSRIGVSSRFTPFLYDAAGLENQQMWSSKLREKIEDDKVNLGSSLAEYRETGRMFVKAAHKLHDAHLVLRKQRRRRKLRACSVPAAVLQYNFGVAPLVSDLYDSVERLRHRLEKPLYRRISASVKKSFRGSYSEAGWTYFDASGTFSQRATVHYRINPSLYLSSDFDFGNPLEWIWELIPFSFVVDWAIPIGEWLGQLDALQGISEIHGTVTTKTKDNWMYRDFQNQGVLIRPGTYESTTYKRGVISTIPLPSLPRWSPSLTYRRAINAVSLLLGISDTCRGKRKA